MEGVAEGRETVERNLHTQLDTTSQFRTDSVTDHQTSLFSRAMCVRDQCEHAENRRLTLSSFCSVDHCFAPISIIG